MPYAPGGSISATNVQDAINELSTEKQAALSGASVTSVDDDGAMTANSATRLTTQRATREMVEANARLKSVERTELVVNMQPNIRYIATRTVYGDLAAQQEFFLPATCAFDDTFAVQGKGAGGWKVNQRAGQKIIFTGDRESVEGTNGGAYSTDRYDALSLRCTTANTVFFIEIIKGGPWLIEEIDP